MDDVLNSQRFICGKEIISNYTDIIQNIFTGYFNCDRIYYSCGNDIGALLNY